MSGGTVGEQEAGVGQLSCASLVDAMGRLHGHRAHLLPLVSPDPARALFGSAVTIAYLPARDDLGQAELAVLRPQLAVFSGVASNPKVTRLPTSSSSRRLARSVAWPTGDGPSGR